MKRKQRRCLIMTMMIAALALVLAMPALAGNSYDACKTSVGEAKMYADQAAASTAKADMTARRNVEMAAADAKALAEEAGAAADRAGVITLALMKKKSEVAVPSAIYIYLATQTYFDQRKMYAAALPTTQSLTGQCPIVAVAAGCESPNIVVCGTADRANRVATPLLTFKATSALENSKIEALQPDQARSAACAILSTA